MSKVKFIQLTASTIEDYNKKILKALTDYPGAIIFVANNGEGKQEIWANRLKYEVGGGGGNVIYGTDMINAKGETYKWKTDENGDFVIENGQRVPEYTGITGSEGSIYVYTGNKTQTAYYWDEIETKWLPFNVDAENVYFPNGFKRTEAWGLYTANPGGEITNETAPATGEMPKNLVQVLEYYLVQSVFPEVSVTCPSPSSNFTVKYTDDSPVSLDGYETSPTSPGAAKYTSGEYVLVNSPLWLQANYNAEIAIDAHQTDNLVFGPIEVSGMSNGCTYKGTDNKYHDDKERSSFTGSYVTVVSKANSECTKGIRQVLITPTSDPTTTVASQSAAATVSSDSLTATAKSSQTVALGENSYTATGTSRSSWGRIIALNTAPTTDVSSVTVTRLAETDIKYYNNKHDVLTPVSTSEINPYENQNFSINWTKSATIGSASSEFTLNGYYPIYKGQVAHNGNNRPTSYQASNLTKLTGSSGYPTSKSMSVTTSNGSSTYSVVFAIPTYKPDGITKVAYTVSGNNIQSDQIQSAEVQNFTVDGANNGMTYTVILLQHGKGGLSFGKGATFTLTITN